MNILCCCSEIMEEIFPHFSAIFLLFCGFLTYLCHVLWWKHESCRIKLRKQGITGPPPSMILGNIPEMKRMVSEISDTPKIDGRLTVLPYFQHWTNNYGSTILPIILLYIFLILKSLYIQLKNFMSV